jgi:hypothetical protein
MLARFRYPWPGILSSMMRVPPADPDAAYHRATITIPSGKVASDQNNLPIRVKLATLPAGFWTAVGTTGGDIRVKDATFTHVPVDLIGISKTLNLGELYFRGDVPTSGAVFHLYSGGGGSAPARTDPLGGNAVWVDYHRAAAFACIESSPTNSVALAQAIERTGSGATQIGNMVAATVQADGLHLNNGSFGFGCSDFTQWSMFGLYNWTNRDPFNVNTVISYRDASANRASFVVAAGGGQGRVWSTPTGYGTSNGWATAVGADVVCGATGTGTVTTGYENGVAGSTLSGSTPDPGVDIYVNSSSMTLRCCYLKSGVVVLNRRLAEADCWRAPNSFYTIT